LAAIRRDRVVIFEPARSSADCPPRLHDSPPGCDPETRSRARPPSPRRASPFGPPRRHRRTGSPPPPSPPPPVTISVVPLAQSRFLKPRPKLDRSSAPTERLQEKNAPRRMSAGLVLSNHWTGSPSVTSGVPLRLRVRRPRNPHSASSHATLVCPAGTGEMNAALLCAYFDPRLREAVTFQNRADSRKAGYGLRFREPCATGVFETGPFALFGAARQIDNESH